MMLTSRRTLAALVLALPLVAGAGVAVGAVTASTATVKVCVTSKSVLRGATSTGRCPSGTKAIYINKVGPRGATGLTGARGATGPQGPAGPGSTDINRTTNNGSGPVTLLDFDGVTIWSNCNVYGPTLQVSAPTTMRFAGTYALGTAAPVTAPTATAWFPVYTGNGAPSYAMNVVVTNAAGRSFRLDLLGTTDQYTCTYTGQVTP